MDLIGLIIGAVLTLVIFSYLLHDNQLYRWALALLVGTASGYATGVAVRFVLRDWVTQALATQDPTARLVFLITLILGGFLLLKGFKPTRMVGLIMTVSNIPLGYLVGVGAAVAVSGALMGTLLPQILATGAGIRIDQGIIGILEGVVVLLSTVVTLLSFSNRFHDRAGSPSSSGERLGGWKLGVQRTGRAVLAVALGTAFAGAITSALTAMVMRLWQLADLLSRLFSVVGG
jgi:hypothetical protein